MIFSPPGRNIELEFIAFRLEYAESCANDWLQAFDGRNSNSSNTDGKLCGMGIPNNIVSSGNNLHLTFHTDQSKVRTGFKITLKGKNLHVDIILPICSK